MNKEIKSTKGRDTTALLFEKPTHHTKLLRKRLHLLKYSNENRRVEQNKYKYTGG